jgi:hypothetical protein
LIESKVIGRKKFNFNYLHEKCVAAMRSYDELTSFKCYFRTVQQLQLLNMYNAETLAHTVIVVVTYVTTDTLGYCNFLIFNNGHTWLLYLFNL